MQRSAFSVSIRQSGSVSLLDLSGRLTSFEMGALHDAIAQLLKEGRNNILLNMNSLDYLDSSGIGELARNYVSVAKGGGQLIVVGLSPKVEEILKVTQLYRVVPEFSNEEEAVESLRQNSSAMRRPQTTT